MTISLFRLLGRHTSWRVLTKHTMCKSNAGSKSRSKPYSQRQGICASSAHQLSAVTRPLSGTRPYCILQVNALEGKLGDLHATDVSSLRYDSASSAQILQPRLPKLEQAMQSNVALLMYALVSLVICLPLKQLLVPVTSTGRSSCCTCF